jgi:hypothetical protein
MTALAETAWYVYAILPTGAVAPPVLEAILPGASLAVVEGEPGSAGDGLAALVSLVPRALFAPGEAACRAAEPDWVAARAASHHDVVARAHAAGACLPLGFGTLFGSTVGVVSWLDENGARFSQALSEVAERQEWGVSLLEERDVHADWIRTHDATVAKLVASAATAGPGAGFLLARRIERAIEGAREAHVAELATAMGERLAAYGPVLSEPPGAGVAAAWSVLTGPGDTVALLLAELNRWVVGTGLALRATGPWPPYAFARASWQGGLHG